MLSSNELRSIGYGTVLVFVNIFLMSLFSFTPLAGLLSWLTQWSIFAVIIFYGILLTLGNSFAETGIKKSDVVTAFFGVSLLQFAYGTFGAGLLRNIDLVTQLGFLLATLVITSIISVIAGLIVYRSDKDFSGWQKYSFFSFIGVFITGGIGVFFPPLFILSFILAFIGFLTLLVYRIWEMKAHDKTPMLNAVGLYVAYMGIFIEILQILLRLFSEE